MARKRLPASKILWPGAFRATWPRDSDATAEMLICSRVARTGVMWQVGGSLANESEAPGNTPGIMRGRPRRRRCAGGWSRAKRQRIAAYLKPWPAGHHADWSGASTGQIQPCGRGRLVAGMVASGPGGHHNCGNGRTGPTPGGQQCLCGRLRAASSLGKRSGIGLHSP